MPDDSKKKGFSGLSSLISDIDEETTPNPAQDTSANPTDSSETTSKTSSTRPVSPSLARPVPKSQPKKSTASTGWTSKKGGNSFIGYWFAVLAILGFFIYLIWLGSGQKKDDNVAEQKKQAEFTYTRPSIGKANLLTQPQIRWCIRKKIEIQVIRPMATTERRVDYFNALVDDYNSRCSNFRYKSGALERARREVEQTRSRIEAQAKHSLP